MAEAVNVYIRDDVHAWVPARLLEQDDKTAKVSVPQYDCEENILSDGGEGASGFEEKTIKLKDYPNNTVPLQNTNKDGKLSEVDDMCDLPYLHEVSRAEL
jgi:myosin heavy subunit